MTATTRALAALSILVLVNACGGGGGGGSATASNPSEPPPESRQIRTLLQGVLDRADTLLATELHPVDADDAPSSSLFTGIRTRCDGPVCSNVLEGLPLALAELTPDEAYYPHVTRNGIQITTGRSQAENDGVASVVNSYGGWLNHSAFSMSGVNLYEGSVSDANYAGVLLGAISFGNDTGTRPVSGAATWTGAMSGVHSVTLQGVHGDAFLQMDFTAAEMDVAFTGIRNADTDAPMPSMHWSGLAVDPNGRFADPRHSLYGHTIVGTFYGPNHAEVGGVFERGNIAGAFGARRGE